jgi:hypothetical protein
MKNPHAPNHPDNLELLQKMLDNSIVQIAENRGTPHHDDKSDIKHSSRNHHGDFNTSLHHYAIHAVADFFRQLDQWWPPGTAYRIIYPPKLFDHYDPYNSHRYRVSAHIAIAKLDPKSRWRSPQ